MIIVKETPLQPKEVEAINQAGDNLTEICKKLKLTQRVGIPQQIVRAYQDLVSPQDLVHWKKDPKNLALHRLATQANRSSFVKQQSSPWGTQYSAVVNFWLLAQPKYRRRECIPHLKPLFHPELFEAVTSYDPQVLEVLTPEHLHQLRNAVLHRHQKPASTIHRPNIANPYNFKNLNWIAVLELWVCCPELQHKNQLREFLSSPEPLVQPLPLFL
jgi:hypothetical protein